MPPDTALLRLPRGAAAEVVAHALLRAAPRLFEALGEVRTGIPRANRALSTVPPDTALLPSPAGRG